MTTMLPSSPLSYHAQTPSGSRIFSQYKPLNFSPSTDSPGYSPKTSPAAAAQARRRSQYKARIPTTPLFSRGSADTRSLTRRNLSGSVGSNCSGSSLEADPQAQKVFLRDRLKAHCIDRAVKAREKAIRGRRYTSMSGPSSDDCHMDDDDEDDDEDIMQDELFRRIMTNATRKQTHSYKISYTHEVGSSFDPDLEDISSWEQELTVSDTSESCTASNAIASTSVPSTRSWPEHGEVNEEDLLTSLDLDDEELEEYAEEYARRAALADFEDLPEEELFRGAWSDGEELGTTPMQSLVHQETDEEYSMVM